MLHVEPQTGDQFGAVVIGAFLATIGGYFASQLEQAFRRRERQRTAALLFGEILSALRLIIELADQARSRGEPYGRFTMRLIRAARREAETYDRNREALFDLSDAVCRAATHTLLVQVRLAVDGALDADAEIQANELRLASATTEAERSLIQRRLEMSTKDRANSFDYAVQLGADISGVRQRLRRMARYSFEEHERVVRAELENAFVAPAGPGA